MTKISIHVFGKFHLTYAGQDILCIESRKAQELISYLLLHRQQHHCREAIATLLWPESSATQARRNLRQLLWQIQTTMLRSGLSTPFIVADAEWIQMQVSDQCWVDVDQFQDAWQEVKDIPGKGLNTTQYQAVRHAVDLYRGNFLDGCYESWCLFERERLQTIYFALQEKLMDYYEQIHQYEHGIQSGLHILKHDRARERTHRLLMRLYYLSGERTAALRQYERCVVALAEELDVSPDERTEALYEQIKHNQLEPPSSTAAVVLCNTPHTIELNDELAQQHQVLLMLNEQLRQLQMIQSSLQHDIQHTLRAIEQVLTDGVQRARTPSRLPCVIRSSEQTSTELIIRPTPSTIDAEHSPSLS